MASDPQVDQYLDAASAAIGMPLPAAHRAGIRLYFELAAGLAAQVNSFELPADADPAPLYLPGQPEIAP